MTPLSPAEVSDEGWGIPSHALPEDSGRTRRMTLEVRAFLVLGPEVLAFLVLGPEVQAFLVLGPEVRPLLLGL